MEGVRRDRRFLADLEEQAANIVERAGFLLIERYRAPVTVQFKDDKRTDPVTEADRAVERYVKRELEVAFPGHGILGEEGTDEAPRAEYLWVLDPLDGTANFANKLPFFGISLALLRNGVPVVGCLYVPFGPRLAPGVLRCSYDNGARVNGELLRLDASAFRPTAPAALPPSFGWMFALRGDLAKRPGELRNLGSICFELAMVAGGGFQYAAFVRPKIWDVAAGVLLVREAGGDALVWAGRRWQRFDRFVAPELRRDGKPATLRDWARPILATGPGAVAHVATNLRPRRPPPRAVRWMLARQRAARRWLREARASRRAARARSGEPAAPPPA